ncbi:bifunctional proline dehydrogenase/L-glutamate gamma-semialdehyde dehydrogenase [Brachybacterium sacelli]|uniref:L-glutamate gamma-semialdehyde dehydrogenase n=2 Tax=Brachybacterium sacelli TaxID=173364 RepID=A0ABS4X730_9MICO|nr:bifunctional proline dehydrogenase/L-glutamate gamma-semialdehyde dehydrogenase [Brachybacterium sacelli]MBP2384146.1 RHH-type proline utilization regulon transcriptional repressor/proline dehydrogenase/delta 1-pyrroline-5-carboxylate dehydrogenase [Brachybacterium sacelli]
MTTTLTIEDVAAQVRTWVEAAATRPVPGPAKMLSDLLRDPQGLDFTLAFVDRVIRPEDPRAAAVELRRLAQDPPAFLPPALRRVVSLGGSASRLAPSVVVPTAQAAMRRMVSHLILDARSGPLTSAISRLTADGTTLNINLLGEAVLGAQEASRRLAGVRELVARPDLDYVSIKVSSIVDHLPLWAASQTVEHIVETLLPLYLDAARGDHPTFVNMDMEEYRDLELTLQVFEKLLDRPELAQLHAGVVLQAYLPDAPSAMERLRRFAERRVAAGGAPVKVRLVKGANLAMEKVDASVHGWTQAPLLSKEETDAQYKRMLLEALHPQQLASVHLGVAGHNLFDVAFAHLLMGERNIPAGDGSGVEFEMLAGMAPGQQAVVREATGTMRLYVPVVHPHHFDVAVSYLVRRLEENASSENFLSAAFELDTEPDLFGREQERFTRALQRALTETSANTHRDQDRTLETRGGEPIALGTPTLPAVPGAFRNTPDTDLSTPANQAWAETITHRIRASTLGEEEVRAARIETVEGVRSMIARAVEAQRAWSALPASRRAQVLRRAAGTLAAHRADLLEVMASETGKTFEQGDPEISEAIDFALYYAEQAEQLDREEDVAFAPRRLTLVTPPWNFPVAIPTGGTLAALVTGSAVIMKPAPQSRRCGALIGRLLHEAGVPEGVLTLVDVPENEVGRALIADPRIDQLILTGGSDTAEMFASWRPELRILAETSGKNSIIVTPHADLDLAAHDVATSAFGHAGQKCSAASLVITVGSVSDSRRFSAQLADAVLSLHVGEPTDPTVQMGPVIEQPGEKLASGLSELGDGETWLSRPRQLDKSGRLFSPGVRAGVEEGSAFHLTEYFGPVLGMIHAETLEDAVRIQNGTAYGLTAGLHSLDPAEIAWWTEHVEAGNLYVNRGITGAIVQRQPFGGWKRSAIGQTSKAGGPNYLVHLMDAADAGTALAVADEDSWLAAARHSDREHWADTFGPRDVQDLHGEINVLRHLPLPVLIRAAAGTSAAELARVLHAAATVDAEVEVSLADPVLAEVATAAALSGAQVQVEDAPDFARRVPGLAQSRIRLLGEADEDLRTAIAQNVEVALFTGPVLVSARVEMLAFLREQAISATDHRYGNPLPHQLDLTGGRGYARGHAGSGAPRRGRGADVVA